MIGTELPFFFTARCSIMLFKMSSNQILLQL
jgi:hypothetical protein